MTHPNTTKLHQAHARFRAAYGAEMQADIAATIDLLQRGWVQDTMASDAGGNECTPHDPDAVKFCLVGACAKIVQGTRNLRLVHEIERVIEVREGAGPESAINFNDHAQNVDEVIDMLRAVSAGVSP